MIGITALTGVVGQWDDNHMWGGGGWAWIMMTLMMVFGAAIVALVVWAIVRGGQHQSRSGVESARAILAERLARGEIAPEEYRDRLQHLQ